MFSDIQEIQLTLHTVSAIPVTPFRADGSADFDVYARLVARMVAGGIRVVTPNGNTSEFSACVNYSFGDVMFADGFE